MAQRDAGSTITIDGGGSVMINFDDDVYQPSTNPDYHCSKNTRISGLTITRNSGDVVNLSKLVKGDLRLCQIRISHSKPKGKITITALPVGVHFNGKAFRKNHPRKPKSYFNESSTIEDVSMTFDGGSITFDKKAVGKGKIKVSKAEAGRRT